MRDATEGTGKEKLDDLIADPLSEMHPEATLTEDYKIYFE